MKFETLNDILEILHRILKMLSHGLFRSRGILGDKGIQYLKMLFERLCCPILARLTKKMETHSFDMVLEPSINL